MPRIDGPRSSPLTGLWHRLWTNPHEGLVTTGRVRMRRLICVGCRRRIWVIVGPPRCNDCARRPQPLRTRSTERIHGGSTRES